MAISFRCPHCGNSHIFSDDLVGKQLRCRSCQQFSTITTESPELSPPPSTRRLLVMSRVNRWHVLAAGSVIMACMLIAFVTFRAGRQSDSPSVVANESPPSPPNAPSEMPTQPQNPNDTAATDESANPEDIANNDKVAGEDLPISEEILTSPTLVPPERITNSIGMQLTLIPAGEFQMGSPMTETARDEDEILHTVVLSEPYYMGVYEVTQEEYRSVMKRNPSYFSFQGDGRNKLKRDKLKTEDTDRFPVEWITREEAMEFCSKLSHHPEERAADRMYRLPTEAEWERACRGGEESLPFSSGESLSSTEANIDGNYPYGNGSVGPYLERTVAVGSYLPNQYGIYDMDGNVSEWCHDQYDASYYRYSPEYDPQGPTQNIGVYVCRGGAWCFGAKTSRSACRNYRPHPRYKKQIIHYSFIGFRVACPVPMAFRGPAYSSGNQDTLRAEELLPKSIELVEAGKFGGAVQLAGRYLKQFPDQREGGIQLAEIEQRWAQSLEDAGDAKRASVHYRRAGQTIDKTVASFDDLLDAERNTLRPTLFWMARESAKSGDSTQMRSRLKLLFGAAYAPIEPIAAEIINRELRASPEFSVFDAQIYQEAMKRQKQGAYERLNTFEGFNFDLQMADLDGNKVHLDDYRGKVVIVELWGTWCPDCCDVVPHLIGLQRDYQQQGLEVIGVSYERMPPNESLMAVKEFYDKSHINYTCLIGDGNDEFRNQIPELAEYPTRLFIDRVGKVRMRVSGYQSRLELESFVKALLDEKHEKVIKETGR